VQPPETVGYEEGASPPDDGHDADDGEHPVDHSPPITLHNEHPEGRHHNRRRRLHGRRRGGQGQPEQGAAGCRECQPSGDETDSQPVEVRPPDEVQQHDGVECDHGHDHRPIACAGPIGAGHDGHDDADDRHQPEQFHRPDERAAAELSGQSGQRQGERPVRRGHVPPARVDRGHHRDPPESRDAHPVGVEPPAQHFTLPEVVVNVGGEHGRAESEGRRPRHGYGHHRPRAEPAAAGRRQDDEPQTHQHQGASPGDRGAQAAQPVREVVHVSDGPAHRCGVRPLGGRLTAEHHRRRCRHAEDSKDDNERAGARRLARRGARRHPVHDSA
jgi:hypothetical protein